MFLKHISLPFIWALFILALCGLPGHDFPDLSFWQLLTFDKFAHAFVFAVLAIMLIVAFKKQRKFFFLRENSIKTALISSILYGGVIELIQQAFFIGRYADIFDFIANTIGCFLGLFSFYLIYLRNNPRLN
jgi:VanZ family protein